MTKLAAKSIAKESGFTIGDKVKVKGLVDIFTVDSYMIVPYPEKNCIEKFVCLKETKLLYKYNQLELA